MAEVYFSDRERGPRPRTCEEINETVWAGLRHLIQSRIDDGSFGYSFPESCPDGAGACGCDGRKFDVIARVEIPELAESWLYSDTSPPSTFTILDVLEFCARNIAKPIKGRYHGFFGHYHLDFDRESGLVDFISDVDRMFARNGIGFVLAADGLAVRLGPGTLRDSIASASFHTGDAETDRLLEEARRLILLPGFGERRNAIEKLWDAFERIKTLEPGVNKRAQAAALLDRAATAPKLRTFLETEAVQLTEIGNNLQIRHFETGQERLGSPEDVDYLFYRMFGFIRFVLRRSGREG